MPKSPHSARAARPPQPPKPPNRIGRPPGTPDLLTPEITQAICTQLQLCVPEKYAAESNGIAEETFHSWMRKGSAAVDPVYVAFHAAVSRARAQAVANMHLRALGGGKGSGSALWMLERRFWREYAQHQRVELTPPDPLANLSDENLDAAIAEQRQRVAEYERVRALLNPKPSGSPSAEPNAGSPATGEPGIPTNHGSGPPSE